MGSSEMTNRLTSSSAAGKKSLILSTTLSELPSTLAAYSEEHGEYISGGAKHYTTAHHCQTICGLNIFSTTLQKIEG